MICLNCNKTAHHVYSSEYGEQCENCSNMPTVSKNKTDGILTRNSWRVRRQQSRHEGDIVLPHVYDKTTKRQRVNPDFVKLYPQRVKDYFSPEQLTKDGFGKMPNLIEKNEIRREKQKAIEKMETFFEGDSKKAVESFLSQSE